MKDPLNLYKLIVLYMLDSVEFPLTRAQVFDFLMGKGYVTFFSLQQTINELIDASLLTTESSHNATRLIITDSGRQTLSYFENRIPDNIKAAAAEYLNENSIQMKNQTSVNADYYKTVSGEYEVNFEVKDKGTVLISLKINVPTQEAAERMCHAWESKNSEVYEYIYKTLSE